MFTCLDFWLRRLYCPLIIQGIRRVELHGLYHLQELEKIGMIEGKKIR
jgi:hypothetical protein